MRLKKIPSGSGKGVRKEGQKRGSGKRVREDGQRRGLDGGGCTNTCMFNRQVEWIVECLRGW